MTHIKTFLGIAMATLLLVVLACDSLDGQSEATLVATPGPTSTPADDLLVPVEAGSDGLGEVVIEASYPPEYVGASQPSVERRIWLSDVVVRATMLSTADGQVRFRAVEYLKGTGSNTFTVEADTANRNATWDGQEAILFLTTVPGTGDSSNGARGSGGSIGSTFTFSDGYGRVRPTGNLPDGYTIDANNPAWIPAGTTTPSGGAGGADTSGNSYITETQAPDGSVNPTMTLADIKAEITYQTAKTTWSYRNCVEFKLNGIAFVRDNLAYYGTLPPLGTEEREIEAGLPAGTIVYAFPFSSFSVHENDDAPQYSRQWITGDDAEYFVARIVDDDEVVTTGYSMNIETARPLPAGTYTFQHYIQLGEWIPCDYTKRNVYPDGVTFSITVTDPDRAEGVVLEALFDPISSGDAVGYFGTGDALKPTTFSTGGVNTTVQLLKWQGSAVTLELSPYNALAGHILDFITGDGTTALTLMGGAATGDSTAGILTWAVGSQPWSSGDELMLRLHRPQTTPSFGQDSYSFSVAESASTFTIIGTVPATDEDGDTITYHTISGNEGGAFQIDLHQGFILVWKKLDYETTSSYELTVEARDGKGGKDTTTVNIEVTDVVE